MRHIINRRHAPQFIDIPEVQCGQVSCDGTNPTAVVFSPAFSAKPRVTLGIDSAGYPRVDAVTTEGCNIRTSVSALCDWIAAVEA